jgi:hypothetical protein
MYEHVLCFMTGFTAAIWLLWLLVYWIMKDEW